MVDYGFIIGELLDGKYQIEKLLGQGGMGAVYRATHLGTKRAVAVKIIHPQFSNKEEFVERFRREAEAAGRLRHPNVVDVTDFGFARTDVGQVAYLVMEYLDGCSLGDVLEEEKKLPVVWVVDILEQVCSAVDEAHNLGIIHRDLKPDNIWLEPNRRGGYTIKVLDFGLVKLDLSKSAEFKTSQNYPIKSIQAKTNDNLNSPTIIQAIPIPESATQIKETAGLTKEKISGNGLLDSETSIFEDEKTIKKDSRLAVETEIDKTAELTRVGSIMGTPLYMSPEQCHGENLDMRADIYSLGVIAYRMLTGETPFTGTPLELLKLHETAPPPPIKEKNSKIPKKMANLVMLALSKEPDQRPASAAGFASALRSGTEGSGTLLRRAISLYSEQFPTFLKISLIAYIPLILLIVLMNLTDYIFDETTSQTVLIINGIVIFTGFLIAHIFAYFTISALAVPVVVQQIIAPLRPVNLKIAFAALKKRWKVFALTSVLLILMILSGTLLFIIPGAIAAVFFALSAPVAVMENLNVRRTLSRARKLMSRAFSTVIIITIFQFAVPFLLSLASINYSFTFKLDDDYNPKELGLNFSTSGKGALYQLLYILVTPLTAILIGLLYLKTRQAGGESLKDTVQHFDNLEIPETRWQARLRSIASTSTRQE